MPYAMGILSLEMLDGFYNGKTPTLGQLIKESKQRMFRFDEEKTEYHQLLSAMGKSFTAKPELLVEERREHVHLMHLLGDPLLRLKRPGRMKFKAPESIEAGRTITVQGDADSAGQLTVDVSYRRNRFRQRPSRRKKYLPSVEFFESFQGEYEKAQNLLCVEKQLNVDAGPFSVELEIPADCSGACHVRCMLQGQRVMQLGSRDLDIVELK